MLPSRIYESEPVARTLAGTGLDADLAKLRELTRLSESRCPDAEFTDRLVAACDAIETLTGLFLFAGERVAEWDLRELGMHNAFLRASLDFPGLRSAVTAIASGGETVVPRAQVHDSRTGRTRLLPPFEGWPFASWREPPVATFTAGGGVTGMARNAVAASARFEFHGEPSDAQLLAWYASKLLVR